MFIQNLANAEEIDSEHFAESAHRFVGNTCIIIIMADL